MERVKKKNNLLYNAHILVRFLPLFQMKDFFLEIAKMSFPKGKKKIIPNSETILKSKYFAFEIHLIAPDGVYIYIFLNVPVDEYSHIFLTIAPSSLFRSSRHTQRHTIANLVMQKSSKVE